MMQLGIFDLNDRLDQLSKIGDPLEVLNDKEAVCPNHPHSAPADLAKQFETAQHFTFPRKTYTAHFTPD